MGNLPKPFLKWVGGKQRLLPHLLKKIPTEFGDYHEPMVGGGALFFELSRRGLIQEAYLSDVNERLIRTYRAIRDDVDKVISLLSHYPNDDSFFKEMRRVAPESLPDSGVAAWFLYLNRTCFNGLYRVNKSNLFNSPFGKYKKPKICNEPLLRSCSKALQKAHLSCAPFESVLEVAKPLDFVYFDPPYVPLSRTSNFTSYTVEGFGFRDHMLLRDVSWELRTEREVHVLLSNSWTDLPLELYRNYKMEKVEARRAVSATNKGRKVVHEALIW
ncbi:MAG: Dam family site-specific DNA-(adenine-N6)-methyltransferase [Candidatus Altiarchaeales archaeon]|nr:Dam family site-specific DNA-(adenine-N6)-methyltransferase [Candidatus Altiarchaeales archaeon]